MSEELFSLIVVCGSSWGCCLKAITFVIAFKALRQIKIKSVTDLFLKYYMQMISRNIFSGLRSWMCELIMDTLRTLNLSPVFFFFFNAYFKLLLLLNVQFCGAHHSWHTLVVHAVYRFKYVNWAPKSCVTGIMFAKEFLTLCFSNVMLYCKLLKVGGIFESFL